MQKMKLKSSKGITLVALVITVIVLLILAGVAISLTIGDNCIFQRADESAKIYQNATNNEATELNGIYNEMGQLINGVNGGSSEGSSGSGEENPPEEPTTITVEDLIEKVSDTNTYTQDKYGNKIVVPAGFTVVANGTDNVEYTYDKEDGETTNTPVVQDGIVIKNATDGNQFVWVPVGTINNIEGDIKGETTEIKLGRYSTFTMGGNNTPPEPQQLASKLEEEYEKVVLINTYFFENTTGIYNGVKLDGTRALDLGGWISSTIDNGGYYIARYEASIGEGDKAASKPSIGEPTDESDIYIHRVGKLWNFVTQPNAATASRAMYLKTEEAEYYSDLVNSYAWDTAIIFIQAYSEGNSNYAMQRSKWVESDSISGMKGQPANTGERGEDVEIGPNTTDKVCNIYDMASNIGEWTTETSNYGASSSTESNRHFYVYRGGTISKSSYYTSYRGFINWENNSRHMFGFRPLLCCNPEP